MTRKYFGTDGIRGTANSGAMTAETALRVGLAAGRHFTRGDHLHDVAETTQAVAVWDAMTAPPEG